MRRVVLVTGPPCAGKTTHVRQHAQPGDLILDQDHLGRTAMNTGIARVAAMTNGTAWVIRCAPGPKARRALIQQLAATEHLHLVEPQPTLINRAAHRPNPRRHIAAVAQWFKREQEDRTPTPRGTRVRGTTTERGYGSGHQQARARALAGMQDGQPCTRCGAPMWRAQAKHLDLDHDDRRTGYLGLAHRRCNRSAGQAKATRQRTAAKQTQPKRSRNW